MEKEKDKTPKRDPNTGRFVGDITKQVQAMRKRFAKLESMEAERTAFLKRMKNLAKQLPKPAKGLGMASAPREHFRLARNIIINWYIHDRFKTYEALHESVFRPDNLVNSETCDVAFLKGEKNIVAVEICTDKQFKQESFREKLFKYFTSSNPFEEVFVFVYSPKPHWIRTTRTSDKEYVSYSEKLRIDLADFIKLK